jgi:hypothetical protein
VLTSGGREAATAGGPVVTIVVPVTSLLYVSSVSLCNGVNIPQQCTLISNIIGSNAIGLQVAQQQTLVDV